MAIVYMYISQKDLGFTATEGARSTELGVPYFPITLKTILVFLFPLLFFIM